jgi:hypothetical protein
MWKNKVEPGQATDDNTAQAHCMLIPKATNTHSEYVILIAFILQIKISPNNYQNKIDQNKYRIFR